MCGKKKRKIHLAKTTLERSGKQKEREKTSYSIPGHSRSPKNHHDLELNSKHIDIHFHETTTPKQTTRKHDENSRDRMLRLASSSHPLSLAFAHRPIVGRRRARVGAHLFPAIAVGLVVLRVLAALGVAPLVAHALAASSTGGWTDGSQNNGRRGQKSRAVRRLFRYFFDHKQKNHCSFTRLGILISLAI